MAVAANNWAIRWWPFLEFAAGLLVFPLVVLFAGRLVAKSPDTPGMRRRVAIWGAITLAACLAVVLIQAQLRPVTDVASLASILAAWGAGRWVALCCATPALINGYGVLTAEGRSPRASLVVAALLAAGATGAFGIAMLLLLVEAFLFVPGAFSKSRPTSA
jgi:hypothetical protein